LSIFYGLSHQKGWKKTRRKAKPSQANASEEDDDDVTDEPMVHPRTKTTRRKAKPSADNAPEEDDDSTDEPIVPLTKIGPPRKRARATADHKASVQTVAKVGPLRPKDKATVHNPQLSTIAEETGNGAPTASSSLPRPKPKPLPARPMSHDDDDDTDAEELQMSPPTASSSRPRPKAKPLPARPMSHDDNDDTDAEQVEMSQGLSTAKGKERAHPVVLLPVAQKTTTVLPDVNIKEEMSHSDDDEVDEDEVDELGFEEFGGPSPLDVVGAITPSTMTAVAGPSSASRAGPVSAIADTRSPKGTLMSSVNKAGPVIVYTVHDPTALGLLAPLNCKSVMEFLRMVYTKERPYTDVVDMLGICKVSL
jgi:hypothetical protein